MGGTLNWEALEVTGEKSMAWRMTVLRARSLMTDWLWGPEEREERSEQMAGGE